MSILSIQSSVVYGYVGNRAAMLALERLGQQAYPIHTVQFSNHTGYGSFEGQRFSGQHVLNLIHGFLKIKNNQSLQAVLSGYVGSADVGMAIVEGLSELKKSYADLLYYCDPVFGDVDSDIFLGTDVVSVIQSQLWPLAQIVSPNHFEFQSFVGESVSSFQKAYEICQVHAILKQQYVVIKSFLDSSLSKNEIGVFLYEPSGKAWYIVTPFLFFDILPSGAGDFFAAYLLGYYLKTQHIIHAFEHAVAAIYNVLVYTHHMKQSELCLIETQDLWCNLAEWEGLFKVIAL